MVKTTFPKIIRGLVKNRIKNSSDLARFKRRLAKEYKIPCPSNVSLLRAYREMMKNKKMKGSAKIENLLRTRPIRSLSGIVNVSVLTKPYPCPGKCVYCPSQKGAPKSYLNNEPAVMRAILNQYDPYKQVKMRLRALNYTGHPTDKVELRIIGGTWSFYPKKYQTWFIKRCFDACNSRDLTSINGTHKLNEKAKHRIVGLSIETRPDFINRGEIKRLRNLGVTMVELGVQNTYDDVLRLNKRGHGVKEIIEATRLLKDAGFKVLYQMMPNLPGSSLKKDLKMFGKLFSNPDFQPDLLKIYPCAVLNGTILYQWWKQNKYKPYTDNQLISLVKKIKNSIPYYVRIQRITRDIPAPSIVSGPAKISNLRQMIADKVKCKCIRCREIRENYNPKEKLHLFRQDYKASNGKEVFLSYENKNRSKLYSLLRLRITSQKTAVIREVHTYGQQLSIISPSAPTGRGWPRQAMLGGPQHKGLGKKLIKEAEKIACAELGRSAKKEFGVNRAHNALCAPVNKIAVISGIGARGYYRKLGYKLKDGYMVQIL